MRSPLRAQPQSTRGNGKTAGTVEREPKKPHRPALFSFSRSCLPRNPVDTRARIHVPRPSELDRDPGGR